MKEIKTGRVKLRSRYIFLAEKMGLGSALALSVVLAVLFFNLVLFYLRSSDNLYYLSFGSRGLMAFLDSFPYGMVIVFVVFLVAAALLTKRFDGAYKKSFGKLVILLIVSVTLVGTMLTYTRLAERIEERAFRTNYPDRIMRPFLERGLDERNGGLSGRVKEINGNVIIVQTPRNLVEVDLSKLEREPEGVIQVSSWVMAVGEKNDNRFFARLIRVLEQNEMPFIERGVHRLFGPLPPPTNTNGLPGGCLN